MVEHDGVRHCSQERLKESVGLTILTLGKDVSNRNQLSRGLRRISAISLGLEPRLAWRLLDLGQSDLRHRISSSLLGQNLVLDSEIENGTRPGNAFVVHDIELTAVKGGATLFLTTLSLVL